MSSGRYDYVSPSAYSSLAELQSAVKSGKAPTTGTVDGTTYNDGYDFLFGGNSGGTAVPSKTVTVNSYYYLNSLQTSGYCNYVDYTFDFGADGAVYSYYQMNFSNDFHSLTIKVDASGVDASKDSSRVLLASDGSSYSALSISEKNLRSLSLESIDGFSVSSTVYTDETISTLTATSTAQAALYYSEKGKTLSVVYLAASAIPEPSAFGLLAGAGALALVASRRRRAK